MELNELRKMFYKGDYKANMVNVNKTGILYECQIIDGSFIKFLVPFNDIGDAKFEPIMDGKFLMRWHLKKEEV